MVDEVQEILVLWPKSSKHLALTYFPYCSTHFSSFVPASTTSSSARNWNCTQRVRRSQLCFTSDVIMVGPIVVISSLTYMTHESSNRTSPEAFKPQTNTLILKSYISHQFHKWKPNHLMMFLKLSPTVPAVHQPEFCKAGCIWTALMPFHNRFARNGGTPIIICTVCVLKQPPKQLVSLCLCAYIVLYLMWYLLICAVSWIAVNGSSWSKWKQHAVL